MNFLTSFLLILTLAKVIHVVKNSDENSSNFNSSCIIQGDIICHGQYQLDSKFEGRAVEMGDYNQENYTGQGSKWPLPIKFSIAAELSGVNELIMEAIEAVSIGTCLTFQQVTFDSDPKLQLRFKTWENSWCGALPVGYYGSYSRFDQGHSVVIGEGCHYSPNIAHEILHALGFAHEHCRPDRNKYVQVLWDNVESVFDFKIVHFGIVPYERFLYDEYSIMHYRVNSFALRKEFPTMIALRKDINALAFGYRVNKLYAETFRERTVAEDYGTWKKYKKFLSPGDRSKLNAVYCS